MKAAELRELSDVELVERHDELKEELFNLRFQLVTGQLDNYARLKQVRREIARVLTIRNERGGAGEAAEQPPEEEPSEESTTT